jgi:hypothetical protein
LSFAAVLSRKAGMTRVPIPRTATCHSFRDGYAERAIAVRNGDADLEFGDLAMKVARHEPLARKLHTMPLRFDAASAALPAPSSPGGATRILLCPQSLVARHGARDDGAPGLCVLAGRDDGMSAAVPDGIMALAGVVVGVCNDAADRRVRRKPSR